MSQTGVTQITKSEINNYRKVTSINTTTRIVAYSGTSAFKQQDTVLLIQMTGIQTGGTITNTGAGLYEFHIVESATNNANNNTVTLKSTPGSSSNIFNASELVQIVRVPSYKNAKIPSGNTLKCGKWDWTTGTGGVLALMIEETLTLNGNIDVSGLGFNGGQAYTVAYNVPCSFSASDGTNKADYPGTSNLAGYKGEGAVTVLYFDLKNQSSNLKGYGRTVNGGGGGNGRWSGGGGGANGGNAGSGDSQACGAQGYATEGIDPGNNGLAITYNNINISERAFMGGGGGAGTGVGTAGGNGGGIVFIVAQKIKFDSNIAIKANGDSVFYAPSSAGAGGGGAGGSILLSAADYGDIRVEIKGGGGGSVNRGICDAPNPDQANSRGVGGGGGGGLLLTTIDMSNYQTVKKRGGDVGRIIADAGRSCSWTWSGPGTAGICRGNFQVQMKGFFRNYIITPDTVACSGKQVTVKASQPQGANGNFIYSWESAPVGTTNWTTIPGTTGNEFQNLTYTFAQSAQVRRKVTSGGVNDFSSYITITAETAINNEIFPADTTLCWQSSYVIRGDNPTTGGGGAPYIIKWQEFKNDKWTNITNNASDPINMPVSLQVNDAPHTQTYRRQVTAKTCVSEGNTSIIYVQPVITGNTISPDSQKVCGDHAQKLIGPAPTGGAGTSNNIYKWQVKTEGLDWTDLTNDKTSVEYQPVLNTSEIAPKDPYKKRYYRRYVTSGKCHSEGNEVTVRFDQQSSESIIETLNQVGSNALKYKFSEDLVATAPAVGSGIWSSTDEKLSFSPSGNPNTTVSNLQFGVNTIIWIVRNKECVSEPASIKIEVIDVTIPNGFSPNGDGINECFRVVGGENATSCEITILDRYNNVVFESKSFKGNSDPDNCSGWWDGRTSSGKELPTGTYFYKLTLNGDKVYKGYVVLKKQ